MWQSAIINLGLSKPHKLPCEKPVVPKPRVLCPDRGHYKRTIAAANRKTLLAYMTTHSEATVNQASSFLGWTRDKTRKVMQKMFLDGLVTDVENNVVSHEKLWRLCDRDA